MSVTQVSKGSEGKSVPSGYGISGWMLRALPVAALVGLLAMPAGHADPKIYFGPVNPFIANGQTIAQAEAMVHDQAVKLHCTSQTPTLGTVCVRDAKGADSGVVRVVTFDSAYAGAKAGKVWVVGFVS